jgi:hypothetical protein
MIEFSTTEFLLLVTNIVSLWLFFDADKKRKAAEYFAKAMIQDKKLREKVVAEFEEFKKANGAA